MKAKRVKIQSEHYPNEVDLVAIFIDTADSRRIIENITGLTYANGEFIKPSQVIDFAQKVLCAEYTDFEEDDLVHAVSVVLAMEIAEIIDGKAYFAVNAGVDIDLDEPYTSEHDAEGRISDYVVYSKTPNGHYVYETDKIVEHLLAGGDDYSEFIVGVEPIRRKRVPKQGVAAPPTKGDLQAQLKQAIAVENFERAAEIRDLINQQL